MTYDINAALERLTRNLKDLESARTQVKNTVDASNDLRDTVLGYVRSINELYTEVKNWEEFLKDVQTNISSEITETFMTLKDSCETISVGFKNSTDQTLKQLTKQNEEFQNQVKELDVLRKDLKGAMTEIGGMKSTLFNLTTVLTKSLQGQDRALANIIGNVSGLPVIVKGYTDDVVQQMDKRHGEFTEKLVSLEKKGNAIIEKLDGLISICDIIHKTGSTVEIECSNIQGNIKQVKEAITNMQNVLAKSITKSININRLIIIVGIIILIVLHFI